MGQRICSSEGCDRPHSCRGFCVNHYEQWRRNRLASGDDRCAISGCPTGLYARGWCFIHWQRWHRWGDPLAHNKPSLLMTDFERFWLSVDVGDCWVWTGRCGRRGYAYFGVGNKEALAHRWLWQQLVGPVPEGLELDHLCRNRPCVNPDHLQPVPGVVNVLRGFGPTAVNASKTHCVNGHPFDIANTLLRKDGGRACRACARERGHAWTARKRARDRQGVGV